MDDSIAGEAKKNMQKAFDVLNHDLATVRSGKASNQMVEDIEINAYNGTARLKVMELATISTPDPKTIVIAPFDVSIIGDIEKGINDSGLGINPVVSESIIRLSVPPLTEERRAEMVKMINQKCESGKVMIRQCRQDSMHQVKKLKDEGHTSEDILEREEKEIQRFTDEFIKNIEMLADQKEKELMTV
jgi:ribosome recycling factor